MADGYGTQDENGKWNGLVGELGKGSNKKYAILLKHEGGSAPFLKR